LLAWLEGVFLLSPSRFSELFLFLQQQWQQQLGITTLLSILIRFIITWRAFDFA
jgi:hypothetical protein